MSTTTISDADKKAAQSDYQGKVTNTSTESVGWTDDIVFLLLLIGLPIGVLFISFTRDVENDATNSVIDNLFYQATGKQVERHGLIYYFNSWRNGD